MVKTSDGSLDLRDEELLAEVLVHGQPSTEELVSYLKGSSGIMDSPGISDARRSQIAALLDSSPAFCDRVSMLQRFAEARAGDRHESAAEARSPMLLGAPAAAASIAARGHGELPLMRTAVSRLPGWVVFALGVGGVVLAGAVLSGFFALRQATARSEAAIARADLADARQGATLLVQALAGPNAGATGSDLSALERELDEATALAENVSGLLRSSADDYALELAAQAIAAYNAVCNHWLDQARVGADPSAASTPCARALARVRSLESGSAEPSVEP